MIQSLFFFFFLLVKTIADAIKALGQANCHVRTVIFCHPRRLLRGISKHTARADCSSGNMPTQLGSDSLSSPSVQPSAWARELLCLVCPLITWLYRPESLSLAFCSEYVQLKTVKVIGWSLLAAGGETCLH